MANCKPARTETTSQFSRARSIVQEFRQDTLDRRAADEFAMQPNHVIESVADLPDLLGL